MRRVPFNVRAQWMRALWLVATIVFFPLVPCAGADEPVPPDVRKAIDKCLDWLAKDQKPDGTFTQGENAGTTTTVPSLAVLAFMAGGNEPGKGPYGDILNRSIDYVMDSQQDDGLISRQKEANYAMYEHGISTAMLAEAYARVDEIRRARLHKVLAKGVEVILAAQHPGGNPKEFPSTGGWRYKPTSPDSDISVTGWQMLALHGAANCGIEIPKERLEEARQFIIRCAYPGGGFGYQPHDSKSIFGSASPPNQGRTGVGILMLELYRGLDDKLGPGGHPEAVLAGGQYLMENPLDNPNMEFYYYAAVECSEALDHLGGKYWDRVYLQKLRPKLLDLQNPDGHFDHSNGAELRAGPAYRTAMACVALCVPYRNLSIYRNGK